MEADVPSETDRLRVLILPEWYPSESDPVAGVFVRDQARASSRLHDVTLLVHDPRRRGRREVAISDRIEHGLRTVRVRTRARAGCTAGRIEFLLSGMRVLRTLRSRGEAPDIVHAHVFSAGFIAILLSRGALPLVVSEHHSDFLERRVRGRDARIARFVFRHACLVCPVSSALKASLEELVPAGRYEVVPNVVDVEPFIQSRELAADSGPPTRLLLVAMLHRQKGVECLLAALAEVRLRRTDFTLDVVGDGPSRAGLEQLARDRLPPGAVTFHGARSRPEVAAFMARSDVFVLPSIVETFGVVLVEAIAAGLPIITTTAVPDHERIAGSFGVVVAPQDIPALRDAVLAMLEGQRTTAAEEAESYVRSFSPESLSRRWDQIYRGVASGV
jgi:glycosyltransferase involved in cell wall biosynthesis